MYAIKEILDPPLSCDYTPHPKMVSEGQNAPQRFNLCIHIIRIKRGSPISISLNFISSKIGECGPV